MRITFIPARSKASCVAWIPKPVHRSTHCKHFTPSICVTIILDTVTATTKVSCLGFPKAKLSRHLVVQDLNTSNTKQCDCAWHTNHCTWYLKALASMLSQKYCTNCSTSIYIDSTSKTMVKRSLSSENSTKILSDRPSHVCDLNENQIQGSTILMKTQVPNDLCTYIYGWYPPEAGGSGTLASKRATSGSNIKMSQSRLGLSFFPSSSIANPAWLLTSQPFAQTTFQKNKAPFRVLQYHNTCSMISTTWRYKSSTSLENVPCLRNAFISWSLPSGRRLGITGSGLCWSLREVTKDLRIATFGRPSLSFACQFWPTVCDTLWYFITVCMAFWRLLPCWKSCLFIPNFYDFWPSTAWSQAARYAWLSCDTLQS